MQTIHLKQKITMQQNKVNQISLKFKEMKSSTALGFVIFAAVPMGLMFWNFKAVKTAYFERSEGFESIERELEAIKLESARLEDVNNNLMHQISIEKENNALLIKEKDE